MRAHDTLHTAERSLRDQHDVTSARQSRGAWPTVVAASLLAVVFASASVHADDFPVGCIFYKASATGFHGEDIQFIPGEAFSIAMIHGGFGRKPALCLYSIQVTPYALRCGRGPLETFSFVGPTWEVLTHDILIFRDTAWYKRCLKPV